MNTWRCGDDLVAILVARDPNQDLDSIPNLDLGVQDVVGFVMDMTLMTYIAIIAAGFILLFWTYLK